MDRRIVFYNFGRILTERELTEKINARIKELYSQGFDNFQVLKIIFECSEFKESFIETDFYNELYKKYKLALTAGQNQAGFL